LGNLKWGAHQKERTRKKNRGISKSDKVRKVEMGGPNYAPWAWHAVREVRRSILKIQEDDQKSKASLRLTPPE